MPEMTKNVAARRMATSYLPYSDTFVRIATPRFVSFPYLCTRNQKNYRQKMTITDFFSADPVLASVLALGYAVLVGLFVYMLVEMYRK